MLGLTIGPVPKFAKPFANLRETIDQAVKQYCAEVQAGQFPTAQHSYDL
jgi:3-methyl-2-oxobutanoate hydroxymethyltransferase